MIKLYKGIQKEETGYYKGNSKLSETFKIELSESYVHDSTSFFSSFKCYMKYNLFEYKRYIILCPLTR